MPQILFGNAAFLAGMAALAIPILIHLLLKRKRLKLRFSTLQFFAQMDEKAGRRRKLLNWLLLAMRILLVSLIVLAFARPYMSNARHAGNERPAKRVVFVLDRSASMRVTEGGTTRWEKAKDVLRKAVSEMALDDRAALVDCASPPKTLSPLDPAPKLIAILDRLEPGFGSGEVGDGILEAVKLLTARDFPGESEIFVISDLQKQSCQKLESISVPQNIGLKIVGVGATNTPNAAVSDLAVGKGESPLQATVANYSSEEISDAMLEFVVNGKSAFSSSVSVGAHTTTNVSCALPALPYGWHQISARLASRDSYALDDERDQVFQTPPPLKVLCIEPHPAKHAFSEDSFFVLSALQPDRDASNAIGSPFKIDKAPPSALVGKLHDSAAAPYRVVLLPAMRQLPDGAGRALFDYVKAGGGLLLFAGDGVNTSEYNSELGELLPASVGRVEGDTMTYENYWRLRDFDSNSTVFAAFRQAHSGDLTIPEFWRRFALTPAGSAQVLSRFSDSTPMIVSKGVGAGRVLLVDTSANTGWSDWPKHITFVPWLHGACHYLAGDELSLGPRFEDSFIAGAPVEMDLGTNFANQGIRVRPPEGAEEVVKASAAGKLELQPQVPGFYELLDSGGQTIRLMAVNAPQRESDLAGFASPDLQAQITRSQAVAGNKLLASVLDPVEGGQGLWRLALMTGILFLLLETVFSNRTFA